MTTTKKASSRPEPFDHATDLADAYRELRAAIVAVRELEQHGPIPFDDYVLAHLPSMSMTFTWQDADAKADAWRRVGAAARRVQVAIHGKKEAARFIGFVRPKAA